AAQITALFMMLFDPGARTRPWIGLSTGVMVISSGSELSDIRLLRASMEKDLKTAGRNISQVEYAMSDSQALSILKQRYYS
ncbi:MAG: hypothetical protein MUP93_04385, partial [Pirellulales bacterium]|nr:hypothetical protein [Pirellulales bacterium]